MRNIFRREKKEPPPPKPRFCDKGHNITNVRCLYFTFGDIMTKWLCPYCFVEFIEVNVSGIKKV